MKFHNRQLCALIAAASLTMAGCGSSGSSDSGNTTPEEPNRVSLTGLAVKGVLAGATITVSSLDGQTVYDTTTTNTDGTYSLADLDLPLNVALLVTMTTNADTLLTCDSATGCTDASSNAVAFGGKYAFNDSSFVMTAVLAPMTAKNADIKLMVTPVTHMAAERVKKTGAATAAEIATVNTATANLLGLDGVDIATAIPSDITSAGAAEDDTGSQRYGALVAGFATLASSGGKTITDVVNTVSNDYAEDGGLIANSSDDEEIDLADIFKGATAAADTAEANGVDLGTTDDEFLLEAIEANSQPEDTWVEADAEAQQAVANKAEAVSKAITLLEELNDWHAAVVGAEDDIAALAQSQADVLADMVPVFDDEAQVLRGLRELVVGMETPDTCDLVGECDKVAVPGLLLAATRVTAGVVTMAGYANAHSDIWEPTAVDGEYQLSAMTLIDLGVELDDLAFFLTDANGNLAGDIQLILDSQGLLSVSGEGADGMLISAGQLAVGYPVEGEKVDTALLYHINNLTISDAEGAKLVSTGTATFDFLSQEDRAAFMNASSDGAVEVSLASVRSISFGLESVADGMEADGVTPQTATLASSITLTRDDAGLVVANASIDVSVEPTDGSEWVQGTITLAATGTHTETSPVSGLYVQTFDPATLTLAFNGSLKARDNAGNGLTFDGTANLYSSDMAANSAGVVLSGKSTLTRVADSSSLTFSGGAAISTDLQFSRPGSLLLSGELTASSYGIVVADLALNAVVTAGEVAPVADMVVDIATDVYGIEDGSFRLVATGLDTEAAAGQLRLAYGSRVVTLSLDQLAGLSDGGANNLLISNGDVSMAITASCITSVQNQDALGVDVCTDMQYSGNVISSGYQVGSLEERNGLPVFVFDDGSEYRLVVTPSFLISQNLAQ